MRQALFAGAFDPFTNGHVDMVNQAARLFDRVVVAVMDPTRDGAPPMFSLDDRLAFARAALEGRPEVDVVPCRDQYMVHFAERVGCEWVVRGLPRFVDFGRTWECHRMGRMANPNIHEIALMPEEPDDVAVHPGFLRAQYGLRFWERNLFWILPRPVLRVLAARDARRRWNEDFPGRWELFDREVAPRLEPRPFHSFLRVLHMLDWVEAFVWNAPLAAVRAAVWLNNLVVDADPEVFGQVAGTGERLSVRVGEKWFAHETWVGALGPMVESTSLLGAERVEAGGDAALFRAVGWSSFALPPREYAAVVDMVRDEYVPTFGLERFIHARRDFLDGLKRWVDREGGLYASAPQFTAHPAWGEANDQARRNIVHERARLDLPTDFH